MKRIAKRRRTRGSTSRFAAALLITAALAVCGRARAQKVLAPTPPLGWNSWDSYGLSVTADEWKSNVDWFHAHLQPAGWQYVVVDEGWYLEHPENAGGKGDQGYQLDEHGQYVAAKSRFPDGMAGLAAYAHKLGLRFGIHIIRGIPKLAVERNVALVGSSLHAPEAADASDLCRWNPDNYGLKDNTAGQAYYNGLMKLYASWGVDYLKVDCISKPYNEHEIHMIDKAIAASGRLIVLSLSPGPTPLENADDVQRSAQLWRISDDVWDVWSDPKLTQGSFPQTVHHQFEKLAKWMPYQSEGHWPDADMLPIGYLGPRPGWRSARESRLTADETRSLLTLWSIARSPLVLGSNLTKVSPELEALLTNREVLAVDQHGVGPKQVKAEGDVVVWRSGANAGNYFAVFNLADEAKTVQLAWADVQLEAKKHKVRDLWERKELGSLDGVKVTLPAHGSVLYRVSE